MPSGGYAWWYIDALSDDRRHGLTLIAFIGSVFSPYYALRRRRAGADPENHVAINVALYGSDGHRWTMTERGKSALSRGADTLAIGPSQLAWQPDGTLVIAIDEVSVPLPRRVRGRIIVRPHARGTTTFALDPAGRHVWRPMAPRARIEVALDGAGASWSGDGYVDHNRGVEPLEAAFRTWSWSRTVERGVTRIFYDTVLKDGSESGLHVAFADSGDPSVIPAPPLGPFGRSLWQLQRRARTDGAEGPRLLEVWEDGPFYARCLIEQRLGGTAVPAVHETLSLDRFTRPIVQMMLPFRMPRRA